jgi:PAS domain S-box-containing protein
MNSSQQPGSKETPPHHRGSIAHFGYYEADLATGEAYWSPGIFKILGVDPAEKPGWDFTVSFVHPEDRDEVLQRLAVCQTEGDSYDFVHRVRLRNGTVRHVRNAAQVFRSAETGYLKIAGTLQDITDPNSLRESLKDSLEKYAGLVEHSSDLIFLLDLEGRFLSCNSRAAQFGLAQGLALAGRHLRDVFPPKVAAPYTQSMRRVMGKGQAVSFENTLPDPQGTHYQRITLYPLFRDGTPWAIGCVCRDITEQKKAELALQASEERFRLMFEQAPLGCQSLDAEGRILEVNPEWLRILGYQREEVIGRPLADFQSAASRARFTELFRHFRASGKLTKAELEMVCKDGTLLTVLYRGRSSKGSQGWRIHCIFLDDTQHKRDVQALQKNAEILHEMEGQGRIGFWEADLAGGRVYWSEEIFRLLGLAPAAQPMGLEEGLALFGDGMPALRACFQRVQELGKREQQEYPFRLTSGRQIWLHLDVNASRRKGGEVRRLFGTMQDVTERKRLEGELAKQNLELTQKNITLQELIGQVQREKAVVEGRLAESVERFLLPLLARIEARTPPGDQGLYELLESTIRELVPVSGTPLHGAAHYLSPRESEISLMVRNGLSSKEIGRLLGLSVRSVETHRNNIRKKLGIAGTRNSLAVFLRNT